MHDYDEIQRANFKPQTDLRTGSHNDMEDIKIARRLLEETKVNLVVVKGGQVLFSSKESGLHTFFQLVLNSKRILHKASVADRIIGLAAAMLCLHVQITSVYADIASTGALDILKKRGVNVSNKNEVPNIYNYDGTELCPFEQMAQQYKQPAQLISAMEAFFAGGAL